MPENLVLDLEPMQVITIFLVCFFETCIIIRFLLSPDNVNFKIEDADSPLAAGMFFNNCLFCLSSFLAGLQPELRSF